MGSRTTAERRHLAWARTMLPSAFGTASASAGLSLSRLNNPLHMIDVYASWPSSPAPTQHSLQGGSRLPYSGRTFTSRTAPASPGALQTVLRQKWVKMNHAQVLLVCRGQSSQLREATESADAIHAITDVIRANRRICGWTMSHASRDRTVP
jgi:hypothetical protein